MVHPPGPRAECRWTHAGMALRSPISRLQYDAHVPAYVIVNAEISDPEAMKEYFAGAPATIAQYGGAYLARGGAIDVVEGDWVPTRVTIVKFESSAQARKWLDSPEYRPFRQIRERAAKTKTLIVEGL
jgi:uncharacterized protein (DUF1330 family)